MHAAIASVELANYAKVEDASCHPLQVFINVLLFLLLFDTMIACALTLKRRLQIVFAVRKQCSDLQVSTPELTCS